MKLGYHALTGDKVAIKIMEKKTLGVSANRLTPAPDRVVMSMLACLVALFCPVLGHFYKCASCTAPLPGHTKTKRHGACLA